MLTRPSRRSSLSVAAAALLFLTSTLVSCSGDAPDVAGDPESDAEAMSVGAESAGAPSAAFPEDFGAIQTVRELSDGTVLVADPLGGALYHVDLDAGVREQVGAVGQGPEEYQQPDAVWLLPGDSTLLIDLGNARMTALGPDLSFGSTSPLAQGDPREGLVVALPQAVDASGRVYARSMGMSMGGAPPDSGQILRVTRGSFAIDTVALFKLQDRTVTRSGSGNNQNVSMSPVPLSAEDAWGAAPDGSVVVVRSSDYHVEWHHPDGTVTSGPATPFDAIPIGTAEKEEFLRAQTRSGGGIGISMMVNNNEVQTTFSRGGSRGGGDPSIDDYTWPESKPAFYQGRIPVDPLGRAWVRRHVDAGGPSTYDVFDGRGERVASFAFPHANRVVGFGEGTLYVVASDELDLNYLHRYEMPG